MNTLAHYMLVVAPLSLLVTAGAAGGADRQITFPCAGEINAEGVNLRAGRSTNYEVLARLSQGTRLTACGFVNGWYRIMPPRNIPLWVSGRYISHGKVITGRLNVRAKPALNSTVLCQLTRGEPVEKLESRGEWAGIRPPAGASFWVSSELLDLLPDEPVEEREPDEVAADEEIATGEAEIETPAQESETGTEPAQVESAAERPGAAPEGAPAVPCVYAGRLVSCEEIPLRGVHYRLVKGLFPRREICFVRSDTVKLPFFEGDKVKVWGYEITRLGSGIPVVEVRKLEVE